MRLMSYQVACYSFVSFRSLPKSKYVVTDCLLFVRMKKENLGSLVILGKREYEWAARVRVCNYVKFETSRNLPPLLKIVTRTMQPCVDISDC